MELKGSQTEKNLLAGFAGESQARNRYSYFASKARKEGYEQIAAIFEETANQEKEHAKREFKFLKGGEVEITAAFPAGVIGNTMENLKAAAAGEHYETTPLPADVDYASVRGLSVEAQQKLNRHRPETVGQASRISGITPAAISVLLVHAKRGFVDARTGTESVPGASRRAASEGA